MKEERLKFVLDANNPQTKLTFAELCRCNNISTKTGYKWLKRYHKKGEEGLVDLPRTPISQPTKISTDKEQKVIAIREQYPKWGPKKIYAEMLNEFGNSETPSETSIGNILKKHNLSVPRYYRRHVAATAPLSACLEPNDTWLYDFKGWFLTGDGSKCEPLTITDGFSRFLIECEHMNRKRSIDVWRVLERAFLEYGLPNKMRSDNGPPFASLAVGRLSSLAIKLIKLGITPEWITPGCPQENGRHERFHLTLKNEAVSPPAMTVNLQQEKFKQFKTYFNNKRPHEALQQKTPASIYIPSKRVWDGKFRSPEYSVEYEVRKVGRSGNITWKGVPFFISEMLEREYVGIKEIEMGIMGISYGPILLGKIDLNKGFKRV
jgi:transposase InsO family protein